MCCKAASAVKLVHATLWRVIIKKRKGSLEAFLVVGRGGVLQAKSVLTGHRRITIWSPVLFQDDSRIECFNDWGGWGYDDSVPGRSPKQPLPGIGLHAPLHGRQASPEFNSFQCSNKSPGRAVVVPSPPKTGTNLSHPRSPPTVERLGR